MSQRPVLSADAEAAPRWWAGTVIGVVSALLACAVRAACDPILGPQAPFMLHIPAAVVASWFGGLAGGVAAAVAGAVLVDFLFIEPR